VAQLHRRQFEGLSAADLAALNHALEQALALQG